MAADKITWQGNWRKMTGKIGRHKRFEIQGDGAKYDLHHYCAKHQRLLVSTRSKTLKGAIRSAERYYKQNHAS